MKKPDRVEAGQWWRLLYSAMKDPVRIESTDIYGTMPVGVFDGGWSSASLIMRDGEYLGSGEHPEPSEWMIETLAEHAYASTVQCGDPDLNPSWTALHDVQREYYRNGAVCSLTEAASFMTGGFKRSVLSLYSILRSLGKW